ncbi:pre-rRNA 2'-O-ribose RNA methyltransferase FTSJ3-like [Oscarella lobularis]|uniref:pre-rRNA 2'-O-ribose RNA methyltransferase FTSJ3-like n=1 Tax=Oscarella lobularis TaxID=121494 RepID=UPI0033142BAB
MTKKAKLGKRRKDRFYHLAKETGYRSRSAFKLLQLNRQFNFLQTARVLIDLCAAPGGWLQAAVENTPVSSLIIGVDLVPIKPIHNVITLQEDITTEKCRQSLQRELKGWKADCVIHDGAPNVGTAWIQDAFSQATLCLKAVKLACDFLRKGGSFVTKVFRSKDYHSLLWVFQQLFKKVSATKPQASRNESAEIFVVCQNYIAPDKIDPRIFDSKFIFEEVEPMKKLQLPAMTSSSTQKTPAEEYSELKQINVSEFVARADFMDVLAKASELVFDSSVFLRHPLTTEDLKDCCKDIRVLGKADIRRLLTWRKKMREFLDRQPESDSENDEKDTNKETEETGFTIEDEADAMAQQIRLDVHMKAKRKKRKDQMKERKQQEKMRLKMLVTEKSGNFFHDQELFSKRVNMKKTLESDHEESVPTKKKKQRQVEEVEDDLDPVGLAIGTKMATSKKAKREIEDSGYHRWSFNDDDLPDWFVEEEKKFYVKQMPVTREEVDQYNKRLKDLSARPIAKIVEAKARKKKKALRRLQVLRKKAESVTDLSGASGVEKASQLRNIYKKMQLKPKEKVQYVVSKKHGTRSRKPGRPAGVKGRYKMVDSRMKKDKRAEKNQQKAQKRKRRK